MTMLSISKYLPLAVALTGAAVLATGCDTVDADDRYIEMPTVEVARGVLVEDFTGQRCTNCPDAHAMIEKLEEQYGDAFVAVSIHAGAQSIPYTNTRLNGLATPLGEVYDQAANIAPHGYPSIVVNCHDADVYNGTHPAWVSAVRDALALSSVLSIECEARHRVTEAQESVIDIDCRFLPQTDISGMLQLWIVENGVLAAQQGSSWSGYDREYVHNNVLRAAANGDWGQPLTLESNVYASASCTYKIEGEWPSTWDVNNLCIVAFVYTKADGVLQVVRTKVLTADSPATDTDTLEAE